MVWVANIGVGGISCDLKFRYRKFVKINDDGDYRCVLFLVIVTDVRH